MRNLTMPVFGKLLFLYIIYYIFAIIGAMIFGGVINLEAVLMYSRETPAYYYLLNFNSFAASLVTLFHFMIINNWFITIQMYCDITDSWIVPYVFFITFWCFVVLILLNVLISLILEIYSSVEPELTQKAEKLKLI